MSEAVQHTTVSHGWNQGALPDGQRPTAPAGLARASRDERAVPDRGPTAAAAQEEVGVRPRPRRYHYRRWIPVPVAVCLLSEVQILGGRRNRQIGGNLLARPALSSQLVSSAQLAHDVLSGMPLPTSHKFHRPFQPDIGPRDSKTSWTHSAGTRQCASNFGEPYRREARVPLGTHVPTREAKGKRTCELRHSRAQLY